MTATAYLLLQLGAAALTAGVCLRGRLLNWPRTHLAKTVLGLGCCWMVVFGPSTESCTFILIAPTLAFAIVEPWTGEGANRPVTWPVIVMAMFVLTFMATWFPGGRHWFYVLQPLSATFSSWIGYYTQNRNRSRRMIFPGLCPKRPNCSRLRQKAGEASRARLLAKAAT